MDFYVERRVLDLGVKIVFVVVEGMDNESRSHTWDAGRNARIGRLVERWRGADLHADPLLEGFHIMHDLDHVDGNVTLRLTDGSERYVPIGGQGLMPVSAGEYSYCDDANEILCRLEVRQVSKTATLASTTRSFFIVQGNEATSDDYVLRGAQTLLEEVTCNVEICFL